jgi:hypothetical protein
MTITHSQKISLRTNKTNFILNPATMDISVAVQSNTGDLSSSCENHQPDTDNQLISTGNSRIESCVVERYNDAKPDDHHVFALQVYTNKCSWTCKKRFRDFVALDAELRPNLKTLPGLPRKFCWDPLSDDVVESRAKALDAYVKNMLEATEYTHVGLPNAGQTCANLHDAITRFVSCKVVHHHVVQLGCDAHGIRCQCPELLLKIQQLEECVRRKNSEITVYKKRLNITSPSKPKQLEMHPHWTQLFNYSTPVNPC